MMKDYSTVGFVSYYRGKRANEYDTHLEYVEDGAWEKDYFADWLDSDPDYPFLDEIIDFATKVDNAIQMWVEGVRAGVIDSEAGVEE